MKADAAVNAIKAKLKEFDAQNVGVLQAYESYQADRKAMLRTLELITQPTPKAASAQQPPAAAEANVKASVRPRPAASEDVEYGGLIEAVRAFAQSASGKFSTKDAERFLKSHHPELHAKLKKGALSGTFYKLREAGAITQVEQGSGRRPSLYVKP